MNSKELDIQSAITFIEAKLYEEKQLQLTPQEKRIIEGVLVGVSYDVIAENLCLQTGSLRNIASRLWGNLSTVLGRKISKNNFKTAIITLLETEPSSWRSPLELRAVPEAIDVRDHNRPEIMIVDDKLENLVYLKTLLEGQGFKIRSTKTGKMALLSILSNPPEIILLDIMMADMDGYEVCRQLKSQPDTATIPIIFLSALTESFDKIKAFEVGGSDYITKPFEAVEVLARIRNHLALKNKQQLLESEIKNHQQTIELLHQSRSLLNSVLNSTTYGVAVFEALRDPGSAKIIDFRYLLVNTVYARIFNLSASQKTNYDAPASLSLRNLT
ncbi:MAG: response regulator, partial [Synechocystis sp.]|nr:response regulator [Synechocystis sp.]